MSNGVDIHTLYKPKKRAAKRKKKLEEDYWKSKELLKSKAILKSLRTSTIRSRSDYLKKIKENEKIIKARKQAVLDKRRMKDDLLKAKNQQSQKIQEIKSNVDVTLMTPEQKPEQKYEYGIVTHDVKTDPSLMPGAAEIRLQEQKLKGLQKKKKVKKVKKVKKTKKIEGPSVKSSLKTISKVWDWLAEKQRKSPVNKLLSKIFD